MWCCNDWSCTFIWAYFSRYKGWRAFYWWERGRAWTVRGCSMKTLFKIILSFWKRRYCSPWICSSTQIFISRNVYSASRNMLGLAQTWVASLSKYSSSRAVLSMWWCSYRIAGQSNRQRTFVVKMAFDRKPYIGIMPHVFGRYIFGWVGCAHDCYVLQSRLFMFFWDFW